MVDAKTFRSAMARLGAAVNVVTTDGRAGPYGVTASAVCSVSDKPPTILVCINRASRANQILRTNAVLCLNVLAGRHLLICERFAGASKASKRQFGEEDWVRLSTGSPVLKDASASLDCDIVRIEEVGTHSVFFGEIRDLSLHDTVGGMIYFDRRYFGVGAGPSLLSA